MEREPNTIYVASISHGKDSIAMLEAIKKLGYPLDRIISVQVWATDTIPADLPEMYEWKKHADEIIYKRYGVKVEYVSATIGGGAFLPAIILQRITKWKVRRGNQRFPTHKRKLVQKAQIRIC